MRVIGWMDKSMVKEPIITVMEINILVNGLIIKRMEMGYCNIFLELYTMDNGLIIKLLIKDRLPILTKINIKEHF